jgi:hypothetical protein
MTGHAMLSEEKSVPRKRGRPCHSEIRQNIVELLFFFKSCHGYELYKHYCEVFPDVAMRSIYYHLKKGVKLDEFAVDKVVREKGEFSWGTEAEKIYYSNGPNAAPKGNSLAKEYFERVTLERARH